jgi:hypothetical protein
MFCSVIGFGNREKHFARRLLSVPARLDRGEFGGLIVQHVQAIEMAKHHLHRSEHANERQSPAQHHSRFRPVVAAQRVPRAGGDNAHARRQEGRKQHVRPPDTHNGSGCDRPPIIGHDLAIDNGMAERDLHPTVVAENPEGGKHGPPWSPKKPYNRTGNKTTAAPGCGRAA